MTFWLRLVLILATIVVLRSFRLSRVHRIRTNDVVMNTYINDNDGMSLGSPAGRPESGAYLSASGIYIDCQVNAVSNYKEEVNSLIDLLDDQNGVLLTSSYEYPGRYTRWTVGFVAPSLKIEGKDLGFTITSLNDRGNVMLTFIYKCLSNQSKLFDIQLDEKKTVLSGNVIKSETYFSEEERSKQPSLFSLIRCIRDLFYSEQAGQLGLYGALGYDLTFQFEPIQLAKDRQKDQRDLVMYFPDEILVVDNMKKNAWKIKYDFTDTTSGVTTVNVPRTPSYSKFHPALDSLTFVKRDLPKGKYADAVVVAKEEFRVGNLFEVVLSQSFKEKLSVKPSTVFKRLCKRNPSPYGFFMNLGRNEYLIGASPEMFVRVERSASGGMRVETCPISGTIERGGDPLEDAQQIKKLLLSTKEESELTMCTDVDRNDKSRICEPGSVKVLGRRQIEMYSKLIHTVDHVEGYLRKGFDALDAFLCHTWAVTVTGAPKTWAIRFIEKTEPSVRHWYGGAVGIIGFDGSLNTGLTLRTIRVSDGIAEVRAGATLLHDSDPAAEEAETELKASALLDAMVREDLDTTTKISTDTAGTEVVKMKKQVLLIDHEDSFVHTLANYLRQTGAEVITCRSGAPLKEFIKSQIDTGKYHPDLIVLSPGPGSPSDFKLNDSIDAAISRKIPIFGVCLGLQGLVEYFGGKLGVLSYPMHGKPSVIQRNNKEILDKKDVLDGLPQEFQVARYHSLHGVQNTIPSEVLITASSQDGIVMAIQHSSMPIAAVQFHPESILTLPKNGMKILTNALELLKSDHYNNVK